MTMMALLTVAGLFFLFLKFGTTFLKRLIGMDSWADIFITIGLVFMFGITATFSGMMTGIIAGVVISIALLVAKRVFPHQKLERVNGKWQWVDKKPGWFSKVSDVRRKATGYASRVQDEIRKGSY